MRWVCPNCLTEHDEPYCDGCGRNLAETPGMSAVAREEFRALLQTEAWRNASPEERALLAAMCAGEVALSKQERGDAMLAATLHLVPGESAGDTYARMKPGKASLQ